VALCHLAKLKSLAYILSQDPLNGRLKTGIIFYQTRPGDQVRCGVGIGGQTACTLTDRLIPDIVDPAVQRKLDDAVQQKLDEKDKLIQAKEMQIKDSATKADDTDKQIKDLKEKADKKIKDIADELATCRAVLASRDETIKGYKDSVGMWKAGSIDGNNRSNMLPPAKWVDGIKDPSVWESPARKIQLFSKGQGMALDWGSQSSKTLYLWNTALYGHDNQVLSLECFFDPVHTANWMPCTNFGGKHTQIPCLSSSVLVL
jgi:hypothetical protein